MNRGDTFTHATVQEHTETGEWRAARCTVTRVALGVVWYKLDGEHKAKSYFAIEDAHKYVR
jgi:hypothetical protein